MNTSPTNERQIRTRLVQSIFTYIATCLKNKDHRSVRRLRLRADQTEKILSMSATDFLRLGELGADCVTFGIDPQALDDVLSTIDEQRVREELVERCIRREAPRAMMQAFFGISRHRYSRFRTALGLPASLGRNARPPEDLQRKIYEFWEEQGRTWNARSLLRIAETLDMSLRAVWDELRRYVD